MTKLRTPLTFAGAMTRIAAGIGWERAAEVANRSDRTVRSWSDPGLAALPPINIALDLDAAFRKGGGEGAPFQEAYDFQLGEVVERQDACRHALATGLATFAGEQGQVIAAGLALLNSNPSPRDALRAFAEGTECLEALEALLRLLAPFLPSGAGLDAGKPGDPTT